jgi:hypothetical protein
MKFLKQLFCKHLYNAINSYIKLGYYRCDKCNKEKYIGDNIQMTYFKFPPIILTSQNRE